MAEINQEILKRTLVINVENGTGADGTTKYKAKNFNGIKTDAALDKVYEAGTALGGDLVQAVEARVVNRNVQVLA